MRWTTFNTEQDALDFAKDVQTAVDGNNAAAATALNVPVGGAIRIIPAFIGWMGRWVVPMPVEPAALKGVIMDSVEQPVEPKE